MRLLKVYGKRSTSEVDDETAYVMGKQTVTIIVHVFDKSATELGTD